MSLIMAVYYGWRPSPDAEGSEETEAGSDSRSIKKTWLFDYIHNIAVICISIQRDKLGDRADKGARCLCVIVVIIQLWEQCWDYSSAAFGLCKLNYGGINV